ncbi:MAG: hypothetical protein ACAI25_04220, partial [Planctomycetota bacterium]
GERPFEGTGPQLMKRVLMDAPPAPSSRAKDIESDLDAVVLRALAKDPERRYASARALREDLERVRAGEPIAGRAPGRFERFAWRWRRSRGLRLVIVVGVVLALAVAVVGFRLLRGQDHDAEQRDIARKARETAVADVVSAQRTFVARSEALVALTESPAWREALVALKERADVLDACLSTAADGSARTKLDEVRAILAVEDGLAKGYELLRKGKIVGAEKSFAAALGRAPENDAARSAERTRFRIAELWLEGGEPEAALAALDRLPEKTAIASGAMTLRVRAWACRKPEALQRDRKKLVAFLASKAGTERLDVFVGSLAPGLGETASDILATVYAEREEMLPQDFDPRHLVAICSAQAEAALGSFVATRDDRHLERAACFAGLASLSDPLAAPPAQLGSELDMLAVERAEGGRLKDALRLKLASVRAGTSLALGGHENRDPRLRNELRELAKEPRNWPARLLFAQLSMSNPEPGDRDTAIRYADELVAEERPVPLHARHRARLVAVEHLMMLDDKDSARPRRPDILRRLREALDAGAPMPDRVCLMAANLHIDTGLRASDAGDRELARTELESAEKLGTEGLAYAIDRAERTLAGTLREPKPPRLIPLEPVLPGQSFGARLRLIALFCAIARGDLARAEELVAGVGSTDDWRASLARACVLIAKGELDAASKLLVPSPDETARNGLPDSLGRLVQVFRYAGKTREAEFTTAAIKRLRR